MRWCARSSLLALSPYSIALIKIRHSHRHENMQIEVLPEAIEDSEKVRPVERGLVDLLKIRQRSSVRLQSRIIFGCRHCVPYGKVDDSVRGAKKERLMSFHGMRCHLLQQWVVTNHLRCNTRLTSLIRHGIKYVEDEDIYRVKGKAESADGQTTEWFRFPSPIIYLARTVVEYVGCVVHSNIQNS